MSTESGPGGLSDLLGTHMAATEPLEPLGTYAPGTVILRLNLAAVLRGETHCRLVTEALDQALPSLDELASQFAGGKLHREGGCCGRAHPRPQIHPSQALGTAPQGEGRHR